MSIIITFILLSSFSLAQDLSGIRVCIDPGHGGQESDDRNMTYANFWESESNLTKGLELQTILAGMGADIRMTRTGNNDPPPTEEAWEPSKPDDPRLSERVAIANDFNADFFISIHSNGFNGTANYTLMIYNGTDDNPTQPRAKTFANLTAPEIYSTNRTAAHRAKGDLTLNPTWTYGYGVLYPANMPAIISEGSFHDYVPETWRLQNLDYRRNEARGLARSFLEYFGQEGFSTGTLAGIVRDADSTVQYYVLPGSSDLRVPVNNIQIEINPGNHVYLGDENNNGFYWLDSLETGAYTVRVKADNYIGTTKTITVQANQTNFLDFNLIRGEDEQDITPNTFSIQPNFPNPFNSGTTIPVELSSSTIVQIALYNILGEQMFSLYNGLLEEGVHNFYWSGAGYPSGIYFISMKTESASVTRKVMLLR